MLVCDGAVIHGHHLPPSLQTADSSGTVTRVSLKDAVVAYERDLILDALKTTRGNRAKAARLLDTTERILNYKVRGYGIDARRFRVSDGGRRRSRTDDGARGRVHGLAGAVVGHGRDAAGRAERRFWPWRRLRQEGPAADAVRPHSGSRSAPWRRAASATTCT